MAPPVVLETMAQNKCKDHSLKKLHMCCKNSLETLSSTVISCFGGRHLVTQAHLNGFLSLEVLNSRYPFQIC